METGPLKSFAAWARTALIREVTARIAVVLAPASPERVEQPKVVEALEKAVNAAGGGDKGKAAVADRVAYTWFNRIIALRFMDANGYTGICVASPQAGVESGQPEILAGAKRGNIDATVVGTKTRETVTGLLNGTRRSEDPQGEAYALLLADYCRYWNRAMPFMFERKGDFTELLIPANLLADDSVLNRAAKVLTADVCQDVEVIGWLYQFYISERKNEVFAGFKKNRKAGADEIPAATQLFTPHWIVRYLVENSLGRLWLLNRPSSGLVNQMDYYIAPVEEETNFVKITKPEELKVIDPACGSGHMLTYAFDLLYAIYEEEGYGPADIPGLILANNLYGTEIDPRAGALAAFALTMKARAKQRTFFNKQIEPNIRVIDPISFGPDELDFLVTRGGDRHEEIAFWNQFAVANTLGSLIQPDPDVTARLARHLETLDDGGDMLKAEATERAHRVVRQAISLSSGYSVVVANPPYMGSNNMGETLSGWLADNYPLSKADLMTAFMERAAALTARGGYWGMINLPSWMFLTSFEGLRRSLLRAQRFESLLHLGRGVFGSDFGSVAFVAGNLPHVAGHHGVYRRLFEEHVDVRSVEKIRALFLDPNYGSYRADQEDFLEVPGAPIAYWLSEAFLATFESLPALSQIATPKQGLATANDGLFLRYWYEVSDSKLGKGFPNRREAEASRLKWFPFNKGGAFRRWYGNIEHVVNWERDGHEIRTTTGENGRVRARPQNLDYYFQPAVTWSNVSSGAPAFRAVDAGVIFGHVGQSLFGSERARIASLGILNSTVASKALEVLAPTIHYEVGSIAKVPIDLALAESLEPLVERLVEISRRDWNSQETAMEFDGSSWLGCGDGGLLSDVIARGFDDWMALTEEVRAKEIELNHVVAKAYGLDGEVSSAVGIDRVSLTNNPWFRFENFSIPTEARRAYERTTAGDLVSYAVGCMFGRYSLDEPGLVLADQGTTLQDYLVKVPTPTFVPDADNVIPIVDGDWFGDDVVERFRQFLRAAFGEQHFEENLRFVTESLGVKNLRDYFVKSFYKDHIQRYKKRPIYWLFSSPRGSFNALIYMHRYTPSTVSTVLNEYLREFTAKLTSSLQQQERLAAGGGTPRQQAAAQKEADRLRKVLLELEEYEHDVLYPLASRQLSIDLDDGVKVNYPKFGAALKKIPGLEASDE
ncbi:BREX-1 system adenine-specific DNA-methyltransferase PglX [Micromonospora auratinigra]|uniref:site-specific DNA-methyltransferase (adenine-specific) n=1 Tax=Micromonospora auratinigra TaxID=261654 RepID=A0A1A9A9M2_9ACTN|nr:BREX-1 system adenine-specific DNA-methyltransferase PglX [Micromonospora auratinigra]SBT52803.1 Methyltransferase domain-containing protein [Micromonospora auratinigra]